MKKYTIMYQMAFGESRERDDEISIPFVGGSLTISLPGQNCTAVQYSWLCPWLFSSYLHKHLSCLFICWTNMPPRLGW